MWHMCHMDKWWFMRLLSISRVLSVLTHRISSVHLSSQERAIGVWVSRMLTRADIVMERRLP